MIVRIGARIVLIGAEDALLQSVVPTSAPRSGVLTPPKRPLTCVCAVDAPCILSPMDRYAHNSNGSHEAVPANGDGTGPDDGSSLTPRLECRECSVVCERVVYPVKCLRSACRAVYAFRENGTTYFGCLEKVFSLEMDLRPHWERPRRDVYGALKVRRDPLTQCAVKIHRAYGFKYSRRACANPTFDRAPEEFTPEAVRSIVEGNPDLHR